MKIPPGGSTLWNWLCRCAFGEHSRGFTIVEVMIVLAISSAMLLSAIGIFNGRRQSADFSQAVYDLQSKIHAIADSVSSHAVPGLGQYTCAAKSVNGTTRPYLSPGSSTGQDCIYLGEAIQVAPGSTTLSAYPVFGLRTTYDVNGKDTGQPPTTLDEASPEPADDSANPGNLLLIDTYTMLNGLQVSSAKYNGTENDILTFFSSLYDNNTSGNEIAVSSFNYSGSQTDPKAQLRDCIEASTTSGCSYPGNTVSTTAWQLCITDNSRQAQINVKGTPTGIVTSVNLAGCS